MFKAAGNKGTIRVVGWLRRVASDESLAIVLGPIGLKFIREQLMSDDIGEGTL